jgi:DNA polymerase-1
MENKPKRLILLDGNALIHRAYHALPPLTTPKGETVGAVYGFAMTLLSVLEKFKPDYIAASFDLAGPTFRDEMYADYKATRTKAPDELYAQIPQVKDLVRAFNIPIYELAGFEADDCVGTIARQAEAEGIEAIIVTGDNDALQLVSPLVKVFSIRKGIKDLVLYDRAAVIEKYGFPPEAIPDYKGLAGDASDNIPGVAGIGAKTATDLLKAHGTLETIYENLPEVKESVRKKLEVDKERAFFSKDLGTIRTDVPVLFESEKCVASDYEREKVALMFREFGFYSLLKRITGDSQQSTDNNQQDTANKKQSTKNKRIRCLKMRDETEKFLGAIGGESAVWIHSGEASLFGGAGIAKVEVAFGSVVPSVVEGPLDLKGDSSTRGLARNDKEGVHNGKNEVDAVTIEWNEETKPILKKFFEDASIGKIFYDAKAAWHILRKEGIALRGIEFDVMIAAYLLQAGTRVEFDHLVIAEYGEEALGDKARSILGLAGTLSEKLDAVAEEQKNEKNIRVLFDEIEMPLIPVLAEMEENGIRLNTDTFKKLSDELGGEIATIERKIYDLAGREFNVNSPKQLAEILFVDLHIPTNGIKKTKTGISTASPELAKLKEYPIVALVEEERELFKLKTTYLDAFPSLVDGASRLHTTYQQAVAATGRLSSTEPNLQNIPAREKWSNAIRGAFEAEPGKRLVGVDYSQIELRVMAHVSGDVNLVSAFERGIDVHAATASAVYGVESADVAPDQRREAKVFNFGLMYGMSAYGLAQSLGIDQKKAAEFIAAYFEKFPGVAKYMEDMKVSAKERGFVETELGRRRLVPEIGSSNPQLAKAGERMAINMPIQGLAADIMKLAMLRCETLVSRYNKESIPPASRQRREAFRVKMLLQVHDELIFEVEEGLAEVFSKEVKQEMEAAYQLRVPLVAETAIGSNWGEI